MSAGIAGVIAAHVPTTLSGSFNRPSSGNVRECACGLRFVVLHSEMADTDSDVQPYLDRKLAAHVADALLAAGYGDVREAAASALRAAAVEAHARGDIGKDSPYAVSVTAFLNGRADKALEGTP